ncbi:hypothetical protein ACWEOS_03575 [Micromonospora taraxaci]|uniref:hypothetical protein n=1 Tax=Micromonospora taraxaci TaxID=1316803 RepID=UPI003C2E4601
MSETGGEASGQVGSVAVCLAAAAVGRVRSVVPIFFGRMAGSLNTDQFDVTQGVELVWRELSGLPRANALRHAVRAHLPQFRHRAAESEVQGAAAVVSALDAIGILTEDCADSQEFLRRSMAAALGVALEFDSQAVPPPAGQPSWMVYELRGQAELFEMLPISTEIVSSELVYSLRMRSGEESMNYRNAMKLLMSGAAG